MFGNCHTLLQHDTDIESYSQLADMATTIVPGLKTKTTTGLNRWNKLFQPLYFSVLGSYYITEMAMNIFQQIFFFKLTEMVNLM